MGYVSGMVTRRLYLREHREAHGVSGAEMARRLEINRESLYRLEREPRRVNSEKQAEYAIALGIEPEALWRPPGPPSLDNLTRGIPPELRAMVFDVVRRMTGK